MDFLKKLFAIPILASCVIVIAGMAQPQHPYNLKDHKICYIVCYAHLDTQWGWVLGKPGQNFTTIGQWIPNTLKDNFKHFGNHANYVFSFEGSYRYHLMKQFYPNDYNKLKQYINSGNWAPTGAFVDGCDVNIPSPESLIRHILYGNGFFEDEFGKTSLDILLPDCFGFPYSLPTIATHCGLLGFSTQKFDLWGGWTTTPFPIGLWEGVDGSKIIACLKPGSYGDNQYNIRTEHGDWLKQNSNPGVWATVDYCGVGDIGGAPNASSVQALMNRIDQNSSQDIKVVNGPSDQIFRDFLKYPDLIDGLPKYKGELVMKTHGVGCYTAWAKLKLKNRKNEQLAMAAEHASVMANWLGDLAYPQDKLAFAWIRFLDHQMHDDLTGTSIPNAYSIYTIPALDSSFTEFTEVLESANTKMADKLNTKVESGRIPIVVYNPLGFARKDIVETVIQWDGTTPDNIQLFDPAGNEMPSQIISKAGPFLGIAFVADMPSMGYKVYQLSPTESSLTTELSITTTTLENKHYKVTVNDKGDIAQVHDKNTQKDLLASPSRFELRNDAGTTFPAWEITYNSAMGNPTGYVDGSVQISIAEQGPARVSLKVTRSKDGSDYTHYIRLGTGDAGSHVVVDNQIDWKKSGSLLKIAFPLSCSNSEATFDLGIGVINRPNATQNRYEVHGQQWADLTNSDNSYGVSILNDCKYGWDKKNNNTLHLTLIHSPGPSSSNYDYYDGRDKYLHPVTYGIYGHKGKWQESNIVHEGARMNQPLIAFKAVANDGGKGKEVSFLKVEQPDHVDVMAVKKAEKSDNYILRVREIKGESIKDAKVSFAATVQSAADVTGQEKVITDQSELPLVKPTPVKFSGNQLQFDLNPFQIRAFAFKLSDVTGNGSSWGNTHQAGTVSFAFTMHQRKLRFMLRPDEKIKKLVITTVAGKIIKVVRRSEVNAAGSCYHWDGKSTTSRSVSSGLYIVNIFTDTRKLSQKLALMK